MISPEPRRHPPAYDLLVKKFVQNLLQERQQASWLIQINRQRTISIAWAFFLGLGLFLLRKSHKTISYQEFIKPARLEIRMGGLRYGKACAAGVRWVTVKRRGSKFDY